NALCTTSATLLFTWYRVPRDLPFFPTRRSSDLEYSGLKFTMYYLAEYLNVITVSTLAVLLFFGGWYLWIVPPVIAFLLKNSSTRSEEHTSELQSRGHLVCRLLLEKENRDRQGLV